MDPHTSVHIRRLIIPATDGGAHGWPLRITLIDFGQSIDLREHEPGVLFSGTECAASGFECVEMREVRSCPRVSSSSPISLSMRKSGPALEIRARPVRSLQHCARTPVRQVSRSDASRWSLDAKGAAEAVLGRAPLGIIFPDASESTRFLGRFAPTFARTHLRVSRPAREARVAQRHTRTGSARRDEDARGHAGQRERPVLREPAGASLGI